MASDSIKKYISLCENENIFCSTMGQRNRDSRAGLIFIRYDP